jgi:type I restriction enzyme S subunit
MKQGKMSEPRLSGLNDEQDLGTQKILKSFNQANPDSDNMKQGNAPSLPKGWEIKRLDDLCKIELGKTPYRADKSFWDNEKKTENVWLSIADLLNTDGDIVSDSKEYITDKAAKISKVVKKGTLLLSFKLTLGRLAFAGRDLYTNEAIAALSIKDEKVIDKYFLYHFLSFYDWNAAAESDIKVKGKTLNKAKLKEIEIPLPPLPEQKRIVSILDECFSVIERSRNNAEQNLKNAKELFESYLQGVFEKKGEGWEEKKLGEVVDKIITGPFGSMLHQSDYVEEGIPVVNPQNLVDGKIIPLSKTMIDYETFKGLEKYALKLGDIVIARRGEMGRCAVVRQENINWLCGTGSFVIRVNPKKSDSDFLNVILSSNSVKRQLEKSSIGATMSNLNQTILSELPIRMPMIEQQQTIVRQLDALRAETQKLEAVYQKKIADLEELKKSILQKAFSGQLSESRLVGLKDE